MLTLACFASAINAKVNLLSSPSRSYLGEKQKPPHYMTHATTFNAPLNVEVSFSPTISHSSFHLRAQNNLASSNVTLGSKYLGTFDVSTKLAGVNVQSDAPTSEIVGQSSARHIEYDHTSNERVFGWIGSGSRPSKHSNNQEQQGHVQVVTSISPVFLQLSDS